MKNAYIGGKPIVLKMKGLTALAIVIGIAFILSFVALSSLSYALAEGCFDNVGFCPAEFSNCRICNDDGDGGDGGDGGGGGGATPGSGTLPGTGVPNVCETPCPAGQGCIGSRCIAIYTPFLVGQCTRDADCGTGWQCLRGWSVCVKPDEWITTESVNLDAGSLYVVNEQDRGPCTGGCVDSFYSGIGKKNPDQSTGVLPLIGPYVTSNDPAEIACIREVNITGAAADDEGKWCFGTECDDPFYTTSAGFADDASGTFPRNIGPNLIAAETDQITQWVLDTAIATKKGESTRNIYSSYVVSVLSPTAVQKCGYNTTTGTSKLEPLCTGNKTSCTVSTGSSFTCTDCSTLDRWYVNSSSIACNGYYTVGVDNKFFLRHVACDTLVKNPAVGAYATCTPTNTEPTQVTRDPQLCKYGCSSGACKSSVAPVLSSIRAVPARISKAGKINVTSTASDTDMVSDGTASRREKIKLECGTEEGTVTNPPDTGPSSCGIVTASSVLPKLRGHSANNAGMRAVLPELQAAFGQQVRILEHARLDKIDFGNGFIVDVIVGATETGTGTWGWGPEATSTCSAPITAPGVTGRVIAITGFSTADQSAGFTADLCSGEPANTNPKCEIKAPDGMTRSTNLTVYCRVKDEAGKYSGAKNTVVFIDASPPISIITSPDADTEQITHFTLMVTDVDDDVLDKCYFSTSGNTTPMPRPCNGAFSMRIGPGGSCPTHGTCEISVHATDKSGNTGAPYRRPFRISLLSTNITAPENEAYQKDDFTVAVVDKNIFRTNTTPVLCTYDVYNITPSQAVKTVNNAPRDCSAVFNVTSGPDGQCSANGPAACKVVSRISTTSGGSSIVSTSERFYGVDWFNPSSVITSAPAGWQRNNFIINVADSAQGSVLNACQ